MPPGPLLLLAAGLVAIVSAVVAGGDAHAQSVAPGVPLSAPEGIIMLLNGTVYVADTGNDRVQVFHPNGTFARSFGSPGDGPGEFSGPTGIHVHRNGTVYVADTGNDRVQVFHPNGTFARSFGSPGDGPGEFSGPEDVHIKYDGTIVVADTGNDRLQFFWPNGTFALAFGTTGAGTGQFNGPTSVYFLTSPSDRLLVVTDTGNDRVQLVDYKDNRGHADRPPFARFDVDAPPSDHMGGTRVKFDGPRSFAQGGFGDTSSVVADTGNHSIQVIGALVGLSYVGDLRFGSFGAERGNFSSPAGVDMTMAGEFAVADTGNDRIQVFHANRTVKFVIGQGNGTGPAPPAPPANGNGTGGTPPTPGGNGNGTGGTPPTPGGNGNGNSTAPPPSPPLTVVIEPRALLGPLNFTGAGHAANLTIDVARLAGPGSPPLDGSALSTVTFPPSETSVATSFATVTFPPGVAAARVPVDGRLALYVAADVPDDARVQGALAYEGSGRVALQRVVEVGAASGRIEFDMPVRILLLRTREIPSC